MLAIIRASRNWLWSSNSLAAVSTGYLPYFASSQRLKSVAQKSAPDGLDPTAFRPLKLSDIKQLSHNTDVYTFAFDDPKAIYNGKTASCVVFKANINGENVIRPYTPTTRPNTVGKLDFVIKHYQKGKMSNYVHEMKKGDRLEIKGPIPKFPYQPNKFKNLALIAGGTGITPMIQVFEEVLLNPDDKTKITLLFANVSVDDILLKDYLDKFTAEYPDRFKVHYTVDRVTDEQKKKWQGEVGYITVDMLKKLLPMPAKKDDESLMTMVCGPPGFMRLLSGEKTKDMKQGDVTGLLKDVGFSEKNVFKF